jgi:hypothetical protein
MMQSQLRLCAAEDMGQIQISFSEDELPRLALGGAGHRSCLIPFKKQLPKPPDYGAVELLEKGEIGSQAANTQSEDACPTYQVSNAVDVDYVEPSATNQGSSKTACGLRIFDEYNPAFVHPLFFGSTKCSTLPTKIGKASNAADIDSIEPSVMESGTLDVVFGVKGVDRLIQVAMRPLGAEFTKCSNGPTKIGRVSAHSHAYELGLKEGWVLQTIAGMDASTLTFEEVQSALKKGMSLLPSAYS